MPTAQKYPGMWTERHLAHNGSKDFISLVSHLSPIRKKQFTSTVLSLASLSVVCMHEYCHCSICMTNKENISDVQISAVKHFCTAIRWICCNLQWELLSNTFRQRVDTCHSLLSMSFSPKRKQCYASLRSPLYKVNTWNNILWFYGLNPSWYICKIKRTTMFTACTRHKEPCKMQLN